MKVFISADMEGISGVATNVQLKKESEYQRFRKLMTEDVNAAIDGAFKGGATEVVVADGHANMSNIYIEYLDNRARLVSGSNRVMCQLEGLDDSFDAIMFVGHHGRQDGSERTVINHSLSSTSLSEVKINGTVVGETEMNTRVAGHFGVPAVFISGDDAYCKEVQETLPDVEAAVVKRGIDRFAAELLPPEKTQKTIRKKAEVAIKKAKQVEAFKLHGSVTFELDFKLTSQALMTTTIPSVQLTSPTTIKFTNDNIVEAYKLMWACVIIGMSAEHGIFAHINR
ncbi:M55 family metallopeptidase [Lentibacillus salinarum]|uniref:M55 family metallopeptidase n=1 Tax=Lentibacillus salinarum TaxID=446820 RepID=A0ABW3ZUC2_9BACI